LQALGNEFDVPVEWINITRIVDLQPAACAASSSRKVLRRLAGGVGEVEVVYEVETDNMAEQSTTAEVISGYSDVSTPAALIALVDSFVAALNVSNITVPAGLEIPQDAVQLPVVITVSPSPTSAPTAAPTAVPTAEPTATPTATPTASPTRAPTAAPSVEDATPAAAAVSEASVMVDGGDDGNFIPVPTWVLIVIGIVGILMCGGIFFLFHRGMISCRDTKDGQEKLNQDSYRTKQSRGSNSVVGPMDEDGEKLGQEPEEGTWSMGLYDVADAEYEEERGGDSSSRKSFTQHQRESRLGQLIADVPAGGLEEGRDADGYSIAAGWLEQGSSGRRPSASANEARRSSAAAFIAPRLSAAPHLSAPRSSAAPVLGRHFSANETGTMDNTDADVNGNTDAITDARRRSSRWEFSPFGEDGDEHAADEDAEVSIDKRRASQWKYSANGEDAEPVDETEKRRRASQWKFAAAGAGAANPDKTAGTSTEKQRRASQWKNTAAQSGHLAKKASLPNSLSYPPSTVARIRSLLDEVELVEYERPLLRLLQIRNETKHEKGMGGLLCRPAGCVAKQLPSLEQLRQLDEEDLLMIGMDEEERVRLFERLNAVEAETQLEVDKRADSRAVVEAARSQPLRLGNIGSSFKRAMHCSPNTGGAKGAFGCTNKPVLTHSTLENALEKLGAVNKAILFQKSLLGGVEEDQAASSAKPRGHAEVFKGLVLRGWAHSMTEAELDSCYERVRELREAGEFTYVFWNGDLHRPDSYTAIVTRLMHSYPELKFVAFKRDTDTETLILPYSQSDDLHSTDVTAQGFVEAGDSTVVMADDVGEQITVQQRQRQRDGGQGQRLRFAPQTMLTVVGFGNEMLTSADALTWLGFEFMKQQMGVDYCTVVTIGEGSGADREIDQVQREGTADIYPETHYYRLQTWRRVGGSLQTAPATAGNWDGSARLGDDYADDLAGENNLMGAVVAAERSSPGFGAGFTAGVAAAKARRSTDSDEEQLGSSARRVSSWEAKREGKKSPHR
jgi:hypothetical protein